MRILNVMMSRDLGGIQQAFHDYSDALTMQNHQVINITSVSGKINSCLKNKLQLPNLGSWCILSKLILKLIIIVYKPQIIICHGNRAINFSTFIRSYNIPIIGVSHNYSIKYLQKCDYILTLTLKLKKHLIEHGISQQKILMLPNMNRIVRDYFSSTFRKPIIIGAMGRFVEKKGFIYLIEAISILKNRGYNIKLHIGGDGDDRNILISKMLELNLEQEITFTGWVSNKEDFLKNIDIFCLPSLEEPFGIILLEAMAYSKPIIATNSGGPEEIIRHQQDGLIVETDESNQYINLANNLATSIEKLINEPILAQHYSKSAYNRLIENYNISIVSQKLTHILENIIK